MKGGSGKTTLSVCLAAWWLSNQTSCALVDADPQQSALRWAQSGTDLAKLSAHRLDEPRSVAPSIARLRATHPRVVVDTPGFRSPVLVELLRCADLVLIPLKPSPVDFEVAADTLELIQVRARRPELPVRFVLSQTTPRSVIARHMRSELLEAGYALLEADLPNRVGYAEAVFHGSTPTLTAPSGAAAREFGRVAAEIESLLQVGTQD